MGRNFSHLNSAQVFWMDHRGVAFGYSIAAKSSPMGCLQVGPHQTTRALLNFTAPAVICRKKFPHCSGLRCCLFPIQLQAKTPIHCCRNSLCFLYVYSTGELVRRCKDNLNYYIRLTTLSSIVK